MWNSYEFIELDTIIKGTCYTKFLEAMGNGYEFVELYD